MRSVQQDLLTDLDELGWDDVLDLVLLTEDGEALPWQLQMGEESTEEDATDG
jgi:hypothetical protein